MKISAHLAEFLLLAIIAALAGWFRIHNLNTNPPGIFRDEAEKALNGWALARTGEAFEFAPGLDGQPSVRWRKNPLFIDVYGVETSAIYQWSLSLIAHQDHPPTPRRMRLPAAVAGTLSVIALFLLARTLGGAPVALMAAFFMAISPWSILFSRWALQGSFIPLMIAAGIGGLILAKRRHSAWLLLSAVGFALAFYTYSGARPFVLAFVVVASALHWRMALDRSSRLWVVGAIILFIFMITPTLLAMFAPGGTARFQRISVFSADRSFVESLTVMVRNYLLHYSPSFLFLHGDPQPRHSVTSFGVLYHIEFLFALIGLIALFLKRLPERWLLLAWLILFPVGAMLTDPREMPHALRSIVALPLPQLLAGYGAVGAYQFYRRRLEANGRKSWEICIPSSITAGIILLSATGFAIDLFKYYPGYTTRDWEAGFGDALKMARKESGSQPIYISGSIALAPYQVLYFDGTTPEELKRSGWAALKINLLPPSNFRVERLWPYLPKGAVLLALPEDNLSGLAFPTGIIHPPAETLAQSEQLPPLYVIYKKV